MHNKVYSFFNKISDKQLDYYYTDPARIWIYDNFLPQEVFEVVTNEIPNITNWTDFSNEDSYSRRKECRNFTESPMLESIANSLNSFKTVNWIESITNEEGLIPDPHFLGGGLCSVSSQSKLDLHTDFNWNNRLKLNRKVNLILYLNNKWNSDWGGSLEFWDDNKTACVQKIISKPNRLVLWIYDVKLIHGFPEPLNSPENIARNNLIHFYYTSNATWDNDPRRSNFNL